MARFRRSAVLVAVSFVVSACAAAPSVTPVASPTAVPSAVEAARADLDTLLDRLEAIHPDPWHGVSREAFVGALDQLKADLPELDADQAMVGVMRLVGMISAKGRDGHMFALPTGNADDEIIPLRVYEFDDGVFVTDATADHADLVGTRISAVGGHPMS